MTTRCFSSQAMSTLLAWRNPHGREENWFYGGYQESPHCGKVLTAEAGLVVLTTTAAAETVIYTSLKIVSLHTRFFTNRPYQICRSLLESSAFTTAWGIADIFIYNPFFPNVMTRESFARLWAERIFRVPVYRLEDQQEVARWAELAHSNISSGLLGPIVLEGRATAEAIKQGATFIAEEILAHLQSDDLQRFLDSDPNIFMFIITQAIFIYTLGSKKTEPVPNFFRKETITLINTLRQSPSINRPSTEEVSAVLKNLNQFEDGPQQKESKELFNKLRNIAAGELHGLFITSCWQKAKEQLIAKTHS
jgi:hypothetical protein